MSEQSGANGRLVPLATLRTDGGTQQRVKLNDDHVKELAEVLLAKKPLPPAVAYFDGKDFWLADGFHSLKAHEAALKDKMLVDVREGTLRDAILHSVGANAEHGLKRSNEDKRKAVQVLLDDKEWKTWSNRRIADAVGVSEHMVREMKSDSGATKSHLNGEDIPIPEPPKVKGTDGKSYPANKKQPDAQAPAEQPEQDELGIPIPADKKEVFAQRAQFAETVRLGRQLADMVHDLASHAAGVHYRRWLRPTGRAGTERTRYKDQGLEDALARLRHLQPHCCYCPKCFGAEEIDPQCPSCQGAGWVCKSVLDTLPDDLIEAVKMLAEGGAG